MFFELFPSFKKKSRKTFRIHFGAVRVQPVLLPLFNLDLCLVLQLFSWTSNQQKHSHAPAAASSATASSSYTSSPTHPLPYTPSLLHTLSSLPRSSPVFRCLTPRVLELRHDSKDGVVATDARPDLLVVLLGVADLVELRLYEHLDPD